MFTFPLSPSFKLKLAFHNPFIITNIDPDFRSHSTFIDNSYLIVCIVFVRIGLVDLKLLLVKIAIL